VGQNLHQKTGRVEMMSTGLARGRSFHEGYVDNRPRAYQYGFNFQEQWQRALDLDPEVVFVTGWNEWIAGRFDEFNHIRTPPMFVDQFDHEHSRDIEPMKGGHGDNYYYQLVNYIRRYKGVPALAPLSPQPIMIDGRFDDWQPVTSEYCDTVGDPVHRNHAGWNTAGPYVNETGRNDLVAAKVSYDEQNIYFYVRTREPISPCTGANWMLLLIDTDTNPKTGWLGYDVVINRSGVSSTTTTIEQNVDGQYRWQRPVSIEYRAAGNQLELAIPRAALNVSAWPPILDFKWADNSVQTGEAVDFTLNGDVAPNDRFNFRALPAGN
jgi:hypothetical protein